MSHSVGVKVRATRAADLSPVMHLVHDDKYRIGQITASLCGERVSVTEHDVETLPANICRRCVRSKS